VAAGSDGDPAHLVTAACGLRGVVIAVEACVPFHQVDVVFRPHVAAAAPVLVAETEEGDLVRIFVSVGRALLPGGASRVGRHVGDPVGRLLDGAGSDIDGDEGLGTDHAEEVEKLIRAERVGFDGTAPVGVDGAAAFGADPVAPVVFVGEASARIADIGNLESLQRVDHVRAYPANVGDVGIG